MIDERNLRELERRLALTLHAAAPRPAPDLADRLLRRTAVEQQRAGWLGLRFSSLLLAAAVAVLAVVVGLGLASLLPRSANIGTESPSAVPSASPSAVVTPSAVPSPTTSPPPSPGVLEGGDRCVNEEFGFTVAYPAEWWANEEVVPDDPGLTPIPACIAFAEEPVELQPNSELPSGVAISVAVGEVPLGNPEQPIEVLQAREDEVDGRPATVEEIRWTEDTVFQRAGDRSYGYRISRPSGGTLVIGTGKDSVTTVDEYERYKTILDAMMDTLEFTDR